MRVNVCLGAILIPVYLDFHSGYSAALTRPLLEILDSNFTCKLTEDTLRGKIGCHQVLLHLSILIRVALYIIIILRCIFDLTYIFNVVVKSVKSWLKYLARALNQKLCFVWVNLLLGR